MQQITAEQLAAGLKEQLFARWVAETRAQLLAAENAELKRAAPSAASDPGAGDGGDATP